jgi:hypothetical protein
MSPKLVQRAGTSRTATVLVLVTIAGCTSSGPPPSSIPIAPERVWRTLERPRPESLASAARVSVSEIVVLTEAWSIEAPISVDLGLAELIAAGMMRRRDVHYVERRRFSAAVDRERRGLAQPMNAPPIGTSPGAEYVLAGVWIAIGDSATLALRLVDVETSAVVTSWRTRTPLDADPAGLARTAIGSSLAALADLGRHPAWTDPLGSPAAPRLFLPSGVPEAAIEAFFRGVNAEDRFDWEEARRGYQLAQEIAGDDFFEPGVALARVARQRAGGSLGASDR